MSAVRRRWSPVPLLLLCMALAMVVYWELKTAPPMTREITIEPPPGPEGQSSAAEPVFAMSPREAYSEVVERPLFSASRRPPPAEEGEPETAEPESLPSRLILTGVIILADERLVLLQRAGVAGIIRASEGEEIDGWRVEAIAADRVVLRHGDTVEEVTLEDTSPPALGRLRTRNDEPLEGQAQ